MKRYTSKPSRLYALCELTTDDKGKRHYVRIDALAMPLALARRVFQSALLTSRGYWHRTLRPVKCVHLTCGVGACKVKDEPTVGPRFTS